MTYLEKGIFLVPDDKKILPVTIDKFSEGDLAKVDSLLEKIIKYVIALSHPILFSMP